MRRCLVVVLPLLLAACSRGSAHLDAAGTRACQEAYTAGVAQLANRGDAEAYHLVLAYQASGSSRTRLVTEWRSHYSRLGSSTPKSLAEANDAVRVLLNVCKAVSFVPVLGGTSPSPTPEVSRSAR